ncbi:acetyltransferase [Clostridium acetobutylicum]|nr:acetyltransferase [Clostridium acetobutylicum]
MFEIKRESLTPEVFNSLAEAVGWGHPSIDQVEEALKNSLYTACVVDGSNFIAMGRIVGDLSMSYFIKDVAVMPEYQNRGIGKLLMMDMLSFIESKTPAGWKTCIELLSAHGKEGFYEKFGFQKRIKEKNGCGMTLIIRFK